MLWCIDLSHKINNEINKSKNVLSCRGYIKRNSTISTYALSRDLHIFPIAGFCTSMQVKCFCKNG